VRSAAFCCGRSGQGGGQGQRALLLLWQGLTKTFLKFANITNKNFAKLLQVTTNFLMLAANIKTV
jgi:hypothetical protein